MHNALNHDSEVLFHGTSMFIEFVFMTSGGALVYIPITLEAGLACKVKATSNNVKCTKKIMRHIIILLFIYVFKKFITSRKNLYFPITYV